MQQQFVAEHHIVESTEIVLIVVSVASSGIKHIPFVKDIFSASTGQASLPEHVSKDCDRINITLMNFIMQYCSCTDKKDI